MGYTTDAEKTETTTPSTRDKTALAADLRQRADEWEGVARLFAYVGTWDDESRISAMHLSDAVGSLRYGATQVLDRELFDADACIVHEYVLALFVDGLARMNCEQTKGGPLDWTALAKSAVAKYEAAGFVQRGAAASYDPKTKRIIAVVPMPARTTHCETCGKPSGSTMCSACECADAAGFPVQLNAQLRRAGFDGCVVRHEGETWATATTSADMRVLEERGWTARGDGGPPRLTAEGLGPRYSPPAKAIRVDTYAKAVELFGEASELAGRPENWPDYKGPTPAQRAWADWGGMPRVDGSTDLQGVQRDKGTGPYPYTLRLTCWSDYCAEIFNATRVPDAWFCRGCEATHSTMTRTMAHVGTLTAEQARAYGIPIDVTEPGRHRDCPGCGGRHTLDLAIGREGGCDVCGYRVGAEPAGLACIDCGGNGWTREWRAGRLGEPRSMAKMACPVCSGSGRLLAPAAVTR